MVPPIRSGLVGSGNSSPHRHEDAELSLERLVHRSDEVRTASRTSYFHQYLQTRESRDSVSFDRLQSRLSRLWESFSRQQTTHSPAADETLREIIALGDVSQGLPRPMRASIAIARALERHLQGDIDGAIADLSRNAASPEMPEFVALRLQLERARQGQKDLQVIQVLRAAALQHGQNLRGQDRSRRAGEVEAALAQLCDRMQQSLVSGQSLQQVIHQAQRESEPFRELLYEFNLLPYLNEASRTETQYGFETRTLALTEEWLAQHRFAAASQVAAMLAQGHYVASAAETLGERIPAEARSHEIFSQTCNVVNLLHPYFPLAETNRDLLKTAATAMAFVSGEAAAANVTARLASAVAPRVQSTLLRGAIEYFTHTFITGATVPLMTPRSEALTWEGYSQEFRNMFGISAAMRARGLLMAGVRSSTAQYTSNIATLTAYDYATDSVNRELPLWQLGMNSLTQDALMRSGEILQHRSQAWRTAMRRAAPEATSSISSTLANFGRGLIDGFIYNPILTMAVGAGNVNGGGRAGGPGRSLPELLKEAQSSLTPGLIREGLEHTDARIASDFASSLLSLANKSPQNFTPEMIEIIRSTGATHSAGMIAAYSKSILRSVSASNSSPIPTASQSMTREDTSQQDQLINALRQNPEDNVRWQIYADWLLENGDEARGEAIRIELQIDEAAGEARTSLENRRHQLHRELESRLLNRLGISFADQSVKFEWVRGYVDVIAFDGNYGASPKLDRLFQAEDIALLRRLELVQTSAPTANLILERPLENLKEIALAYSSIRSETLRTLGTNSRSLRRLELQECSINDVGVRAIAESGNLSSLRTLVLELELIDRENFGDEGIKAIANSPALSSLENLQIKQNYYLSDQGLLAIANSRTLRSLKELHLTNSSITADGIRNLAGSSALSSVRSLDLRALWLYYPDAPGLLEQADLDGNDLAQAIADSSAFPSLRTINLSYNGIGDVGVRAILQSNTLPQLQELKIDLDRPGIKRDELEILARARNITIR